ncbi:MAG: NUDIX hydrolase [Desulfatiglandales bacterium]
MKREYPERPIVGVAAVIFQGNAVLLAKRNKEPGKDEWSLPGGAVELGETLAEALKREVFEEVSVLMEIGGLIRLIDRIVHDKQKRVRYHYIIADYWGWVLSGTPKAGSDVAEIISFGLESLEAMHLNKEVHDTILQASRLKDIREQRGLDAALKGDDLSGS